MGRLHYHDRLDRSGQFQRRNDEFFAQYKAGTLDIHDYVRFATEAVRRHGAIESVAAHAHFMRSVIEPAIKPQALSLVREHQRAGDTVVIVTATNEFVTARLHAPLACRS